MQTLKRCASYVHAIIHNAGKKGMITLPTPLTPGVHLQSFGELQYQQRSV
jgi:hypothetical protein